MWYHLGGSQIVSAAPCHIERRQWMWGTCRSCCLRRCPGLGQDVALGAGCALGTGHPGARGGCMGRGCCSPGQTDGVCVDGWEPLVMASAPSVHPGMEPCCSQGCWPMPGRCCGAHCGATATLLLCQPDCFLAGGTPLIHCKCQISNRFWPINV